ncbi:hypothetical protein GCM10023192_53290 [Amycolatopsis samaneae]
MTPAENGIPVRFPTRVFGSDARAGCNAVLQRSVKDPLPALNALKESFTALTPEVANGVNIFRWGVKGS